MKNIKVHAIVLALIIIAEMIGNVSFKIGVGTIVLLPMLYALFPDGQDFSRSRRIDGKIWNYRLPCGGNSISQDRGQPDAEGDRTCGSQ